MADVTERLKLYLTPASTDKTFLSWRTEMSGDTDSNMVKLDEAIAVLQDAMAGKQEELTFDDTPAADSRNPVTSAGIKSYVDAAVAGKDIGVSTFNGRTGAVTPAAGDYTCEMVGADPAGSAAAVQSGLDTHVGGRCFPHHCFGADCVERKSGGAPLYTGHPDGGRLGRQSADSIRPGRLRRRAYAVAHPGRRRDGNGGV